MWYEVLELKVKLKINEFIWKERTKKNWLWMSLTAYARIKHLEDDENENKILLMEKQFPEEKQRHFYKT